MGQHRYSVWPLQFSSSGDEGRRTFGSHMVRMLNECAGEIGDKTCRVVTLAKLKRYQCPEDIGRQSFSEQYSCLQLN